MSKVKALIQALDTSRDTVAHEVIAQLVKIGRRALVPLLNSAESDASPKVRKWALEALGELGAQEAIPLLERALKHEKMTVRFHAVHGLKKAGAKATFRKIAKLLKEDESGGVRMASLEALVSLKGPALSAALKQALQDPKPYIRKAAQKALDARLSRSDETARRKKSTSAR